MMRLDNFIDGQRVAPHSGRYFDSFNPATAEVIFQISDSETRDVDLAVEAARRAFPAWSRTPTAERANILYRVADLIEKRKREFAEAESRDQGKPVWLAEAMDISRVAHNFRFFAGAILHQKDEAMRVNEGALNYISHRPVGVAGLISPWNLPLYLLTWKIAPAIAFGNTAVCKPSEMTSLTASMLADVLREAGVPNGVVNIVFGRGTTAGAALVAHPDVPLVSFTGGTATGRAIAAIAAPMFKKLSLELGGKNPVLIFADCDLDRAVDETVRSSFLNQGEICLCGSRIYVEDAVYEPFMERFVARTRELKVGDPADRATKMGPLVSREHLEKVESFLAIARDEGVRFATGGGKPELPERLKNGYFLEPTILTDVEHLSRIQQEEIFGPVVSVTRFANGCDDEAIRLANGVKYGLSAVVWTENLKRALRTAELLEAGTVWINTWMMRDLRAPFGGVKASGLGREGQDASREFFTEAKTVCVNHGM